MSHRRRYHLYLFMMIAVPVAAAYGWWQYWPQYQLRQAERAVAAEQWERAIELASPLAYSNSPDPRALLIVGRASRKLGKHTDAERAIVQASRSGADEAAVRRELALTRAELHFSPLVESFLVKSLADHPDDFEVLAALARGTAEDGRWADAVGYFDRALALKPDDFDLRLDRGYLRLLAATEYASGSAAESAADFAELVRRDPNHYLARLYLAHSLLVDAKLDEGRIHLLICRRLAPDAPEPLIGLAQCAVEENDWDEADRLLRQALQRDPQSTSALTLLGDLHLRREQYAEAANAYRQVIALIPDQPRGHLKLSQALRGLNKDAEADAALAEYKRLAQQAGQVSAGNTDTPQKPFP